MIFYQYNKVKKVRKPKPINKTMWAVFAPDGHLQSRSLADTKRLSESMTPSGTTEATWKDYKAAGFRVHKVKVVVKIIE